MEVYTDYGPDSDLEIELKRRLADLQQRYREEAQPLIDALAREHSFKIPRVFVVPSSLSPAKVDEASK